jgi:1-aminocyclopropane-1-carboxylate deaminase/D-cysteine desulfhydrase-like pyridoxal-dependent ACC family enzyme
MKSEKEIEEMARNYASSVSEETSWTFEMLRDGFFDGYNQAQKDIIEEVEKLKKQNEILIQALKDIGSGICYGNGCDATARQALKDIEEVK